MKVKIILEKGETAQDADELLLKALDLHRTGEVHTRESFEDPAMIDVSQRLAKVQEGIYKEMLEEIEEALEEEYNGNL